MGTHIASDLSLKCGPPHDLHTKTSRLEEYDANGDTFSWSCRAGNKDSPAQCPAFAHATRTSLPGLVDGRLSDRSWTLTSVVWSRLRPSSVLVGPVLMEIACANLGMSPVRWLMLATCKALTVHTKYAHTCIYVPPVWLSVGR